MEKRKKKFDVKNVLTISFAHLIHDTYSAFLAPILPLLIEQLGISLFLAGILDVSRKIPTLLNPLLGIIADRTSVRYFVIIAPALTTISMSLLGLSPNYIILLVLVLVAGLASALFHIPSPGMIKYFSFNQLGKGMSFYMLGGELARTLGPLVILGAVSLWGLNGTYKLIPFGLVASLILFFKLRKVQLEKKISEHYDHGIKQTFFMMLPLFISLAGIIFFRAAMKSALTIFLPTYLTNKGLSIWTAGISLSILQFSGAIGTYFAGSLSDKIGRKKVLLSAAIINPLLMWLFVNARGIFVLPLLIVSGFFLFTTGPVMLALVHDVDSKHSSFINGIYMTISFVFGSLMTLLIGVAADRFGMNLTYTLAAYVSAGAIPFVIFIKIKNK
ncbi:MAG: MFS transporter [Spirochaetaceae bacterium]|nr:MFS transporter [Spirochaetaceae bacterium]